MMDKYNKAVDNVMNTRENSMTKGEFKHSNQVVRYVLKDNKVNELVALNKYDYANQLELDEIDMFYEEQKVKYLNKFLLTQLENRHTVKQYFYSDDFYNLNEEEKFRYLFDVYVKRFRKLIKLEVSKLNKAFIKNEITNDTFDNKIIEYYIEFGKNICLFVEDLPKAFDKQESMLLITQIINENSLRDMEDYPICLKETSGNPILMKRRTNYPKETQIIFDEYLQKNYQFYKEDMLTYINDVY